MVELVDDDDVEVVGLDAGQARRHSGSGSRRRRARRREVSGRRPTARRTHGPAEPLAERGQALVEDLLPVGDEEEARPGERLAQASVVDGGHHRLAGAGRRDEQVAVMASLARQGDLLEQPLLEGLGPKLDRAEEDALGRSARSRRCARGTRRGRRARSRRSSSRSRRPRRACRRRPGSVPPATRTFHSRPLTWAEWVRLEDPT